MRGAAIVTALATAFGAGCYKNIDQAADTGEDGEYDGAEPYPLDPKSGSVTIEDTVSYPGGDRVDWSLVELPAGATGAITIDLSWKSPRPGLDLSFIVYDQYGRKVAHEKPKKKRSNKKRGSKSTSLGGAAGSLYIEVYASERRDAGDYELTVSFVPLPTKLPDGPLDVPMPPKIAAIYPECDLENIDPKNPDCKGKTGPVAVVPCDPKHLDRDNPECYDLYPECDATKIDATNPKCDGVTPVVEPPPPPKDAEITDYEESGTGTKITVNLGREDGVEKGWTGIILDKDGKPLANGSFKCDSVKAHACYGKVKASPAIVKKNMSVRLSPPLTSP